MLKEINPEYWLEGLMLKLKLQHFSYPKWRFDSLEKTLMLGKIEIRRRRDNTGWDGCMASLIQWTWVWTNSRRQWRTGNSTCCSPWGCKETWLSNNNITSNCWETDAILKNVQNNLANITYLSIPSPWVYINIFPNYVSLLLLFSCSVMSDSLQPLDFTCITAQENQTTTSRIMSSCCEVQNIWFLHKLPLFWVIFNFFA